MQPEERTDVLVVGAGPTGLTAALCLLKLGVAVTIIDGKDGPTRESRALGVQARTLEIYDQLGLAPQVLAEAWPADSVVPGYEDRHFSPVQLRPLGQTLSPYPSMYVLEQSKNERILAGALDAAGNPVRWGTRLSSLELESRERGGGGQSVRATVMRVGDGAAVICARYCIGADGASSSARSMIGIPFLGVTNPHTFYVSDAVGVTGLVEGRINMRMADQDFLLTFPMGTGGANRLLGVVPGDRADLPPEVVEGEVRERLRRVFGVHYDSAAWFSTYRVHHRIAARFREGPVFVAGDAAHVHSPVGAQGMNTGIQDAHNLVCKIADVVQGRAADSYLGRYEAERRPVAARLVSTTDRLFGVVTSRRRVPRLLRRRIVPFVAPIAVRFLPRISGASRIFEYLSQIRIHYPMMPTAQGRRGHRDPVVGRRLPWTGENYDCLRSMRWQIHSYGADTAAVAVGLGSGLGVQAQAFRSAGSSRLRPDRLYLVRPDGFVAAQATPAEARAVFQAALQLA
ncbi:FAD-dependent monooxygenase [Naasia aerilata]|uniref:2-polyprenyl-6-methoxyphenol hydroxylase n=1 Tax=Naasia aerilata TaxID=1162966 RepID=A0ABM8G9H7_9MICO|nr:FAD-dependent monooxygenase [Naasia aerilata]BDZ44841.1 2-polyprenyl-6-methoxyphenol hydroxylase [Naasia aerilata]